MEGHRRKASGFLHPLELRVQIKLGLTFFFTFIVPVIIFGMLLLLSINRILVNNHYLYQESNIKQLVDELDSYLIDLNRTARDLTADIPFSITLSRNPEDFADLEQWNDHRTGINERIRSRVSEETTVTGFFLMTERGVFYQSTEFADMSGLESIIPYPVKAGIVDQGRNLMLFRTSVPGMGVGRAGDVLYCAMPLSVIFLEKKRFGTGILVLMLDTSEIESIFERHNPLSSPIYLFDEEGKFVYSNNREVTFKTIPSDLAEQARVRKSGRYTLSDRSNNVLINYSTSRFNTVKVFVYGSDDLIRNDVYFLSLFTLVFLAALILLFFLFIIFLSYSISSPINRLRIIMTQLEGSNFQDASELLNRRNRGVLATYFDKFYAFIYTVLTRINEYHSKEKEHELLVLQTQINPHFVYNTLNTIRIMAELDGQERLAKAVRSLIHLLKGSIKLGSVFIGIKDEIQQIRDYISLQKLRYGDSFRVRFSIDSAALEYRCIKFILQPIVENAIFHGIDPSSGTGQIDISVQMAESVIQYRVSDNGSGIDSDTLMELRSLSSTSPPAGKIGIKNVNSRLQSYFGPDSRLEIESTIGEGTTVSYRIPAERHES